MTILLCVAIMLTLIIVIASVVYAVHFKAKYELEHDKVFAMGRYIYLHVYDHVGDLRSCGLNNEDVYEILCSIEEKED